MKTRVNAHSVFLKNIGKKVESEIIKAGYSSVYEFWVEKAGDHMSRSALNYIVRGKTEVRITSLKVIADLLEKNIKDFL